MPREKKSKDISRKQLMRLWLAENPEMTNVAIRKKFDDEGLPKPALNTLTKWRKAIEENQEQGGRLDEVPEWQELKETVKAYDDQIAETKKELKKLKSENAKASYKRLLKDLTKEKMDSLKQIVEIRSDLLKKSRPHYLIKIGDFKEAKEK